MSPRTESFLLRFGIKTQITLIIGAGALFVLGVVLSAARPIPGPMVTFFIAAALFIGLAFLIRDTHAKQRWLAESVDLNQEVKIYGSVWMSMVMLAVMVLGGIVMYSIGLHQSFFDLLLGWVFLAVLGVWLIFASRLSPFRRPDVVLNPNGIGSMWWFVPWACVQSMQLRSSDPSRTFALRTLIVSVKRPGSYGTGTATEFFYRLARKSPSVSSGPFSTAVSGMSLAPEHIYIMAMKYLEAARGPATSNYSTTGE